MAEPVVMNVVTHEEIEIERPDISHLVTEDDTPVDNARTEKQMRLLTHVLYAAWNGPGDGRPFIVMANVGLFFALQSPPLVPDVLLSLDVRYRGNPDLKENRSYFIWEYGKPPDVVIEIVSNRVGGELGNKLLDYARLGVSYYVVYDPQHHLSELTLRVFGRLPTGYAELPDTWLAAVGLGLTLWEGEFETMQTTWLRWCDRSGELVLTGEELAARERRRAEVAEQEAQRERLRAEDLAAKLRALGVDPDA